MMPTEGPPGPASVSPKEGPAEPTIVAYAFDSDGYRLRAQFKPVDILLMSDGSVRWQEQR